MFQAHGTNIRFFRMDIFDRWGELIYTLQNLSDSWDGKYKSEPVPLGVYVYKVTYVDYLDDEEKYIMGHVNVLR
jgi:gliding motility-associated-like protein